MSAKVNEIARGGKRLALLLGAFADATPDGSLHFCGVDVAPERAGAIQTLARDACAENRAVWYNARRLWWLKGKFLRGWSRRLPGFWRTRGRPFSSRRCAMP